MRAIHTEEGARPSRKILIRAVMARSHAPHTVTGLPPAMAMTGRCDFLAGHAATAWTHNPDAVGPAKLQSNALSRILTARTSAMAADAERALTTCLQRNIPGRSTECNPIGDKGRISQRGEWVGDWRVVAHSSSNLILGKGRKITKRPKINTRRAIPDTGDQLDRAPVREEEDTTSLEDTGEFEDQVPRGRPRTRSTSIHDEGERGDPMANGDSGEEMED